ncbi:MAG TPA: isoprenylcysteine carboxylmethyltransferase family protein, partial [Candidatus Omnitrophota bacterium]|nr:isoprenylcysteine carboxylmethyltransferase family protein [Candidatus Omnitrophota bacterium]
MKYRIKLNGYVLFAAGLALLSFPGIFIRRESGSSDDLWEMIAIALVLAGQLLRVSARGYKSEHSYGGNHLVQGGPYSLVRHPMYLGIILIGCGVVLFILRPWTILIFAAGFLFRYRSLFNNEENTLAKKFGNEYEDYCHRVPRIVPRFSVLATRDISSYLPVRLSWFIRETPSIIGIIALCVAVESWEEIYLHGPR